MKYNLFKKHLNSSIITLILIIINTILAILYEPRIYIIILSILFIVLSYIATIKYVNEFELPLFFIRDDYNYWGGLFGGLSGAIGYFIGYEILINYNITTAEILPTLVLIFSIFYLLILSLTATIIQDIKNTDYMETN